MARYVKISVIGAAMYERGNSSGVDAAITHLRAEIDQVLPDHPDLIVLPEFCDMCRSDSIDQYRALSSERGDAIVEFLAGIARQYGTWITCPSLRQNERGSWRNGIHLIDRQGKVAGTYDKNCLTMGELEAGIKPGTETPVVKTDFGSVAMAICFDLNFDELRARVAKARPDLILFCSMYHGGLMQEYWAYSCRAHFAAAVTGLPSRVISPVGQTLASTTNYFDFVTTRINLDCSVVHLDYNAEKLRDLKRKYGPGVTILDPGLLAPVLVSSEIEGVTADDMLNEFGIQTLDIYLDRCRQKWS